MDNLEIYPIASWGLTFPLEKKYNFTLEEIKQFMFLFYNEHDFVPAQVWIRQHYQRDHIMYCIHNYVAKYLEKHLNYTRELFTLNRR